MTGRSVNIIEFINTAKERKPRGKKAQKAQIAPKENRIINKRNPFRFFKNLDISVMRDEIDSFVEKTGWITDKNPDRYTELNEWDRAIISMFTSLKTGIPAILLQDFFTSFDEDPSNNIVQFFINYKRRPDVQVQIMDMKELLRRRKAKPNSKRKIKEVLPNYRIAKTINENKKIIDTPVQRPVPKYQTNEIKSRCEQQYPEAPWMFAFTNRSIKGFVLNDIDEKYTINQEVMPGWRKVSKEWYKMSCRGERVFIPNFVGYLTSHDEIIIESEDMYEASKRDWNNEYTPLTNVGYKIAKDLLMENIILKSTYSGSFLNSYVNDILASFGTLKTNYDLARRISYVYVFLSPIIDRPQKYHAEFRRKMYTGDQLLTLPKDDVLLPEINDPGTDVKLINNKINTLRRTIERKYYKRVSQDDRDPAIRKRLGRVRYEAPARKSDNNGPSFEPIRPIEKQQNLSIDHIQKQIIHEEPLNIIKIPNQPERRKIIPVRRLKSPIQSPQIPNEPEPLQIPNEPEPLQIPNEPEPLQIPNEPARRILKAIRRKSPVIPNEPVPVQQFEEPIQTKSQTSEERLKLMPLKRTSKNEELAPGLFGKLRDIIGQKSPIECNKCHKEVSGAPYSTPFQSERLTFCSKKCFEKYNI